MNILWLSSIWPEPLSSAAGVRTVAMMRALIAAGHSVHMASPCAPNAAHTAVRELGVGTSSVIPNDPHIAELLERIAPDVVFFDRFMVEEQFSWRVRELCPQALRVLDSIDLHCLRRGREQAARGNTLVQASSELSAQAVDTQRELASIFRSDLTLLVSNVEQEILVGQCGVSTDLLLLCPPSFTPTPTVNNYAERRDFVTIGNFHHAPNRDSVRMLHQEVWPRIQEVLHARSGSDGVELHVYGSYPPRDIMKLDDPSSGFRVKGWADDVREVLARYRVNLAPLRFGAGIKGKVADGWVVGTPCVGTSIAAEGMTDNGSFGGVVEDNWDSFAHAAVSLYDDHQKWQAAQTRGVDILRSRFAADACEGTLSERLTLALGSLSQRRGANFVGTMLWYHAHRSTEYFARWIECKERRGSS